MKKTIGFVFVIICIMCFLLCACSDNVENVKIKQVTSEMYSQQDISMAIDALIEEFDSDWNNCTLNELYYAGDKVTQEHQEWAERYDADEAIVLSSVFFVDRADSAASMNAGTTYEWIWILVRTGDENWTCVDYGFY